MTAPIVATVTYAGTVIANQISTSPWLMAGVQFPEYGGIPTSPQFLIDLLQPDNMDGARYRLGGAHLPRFVMTSILGVIDFKTATSVARQMELTMGDFVTVDFPVAGVTGVRLFVHGNKSFPNPKTILGGSAGSSFNTVITGSCVDSTWDMQVAPL